MVFADGGDENFVLMLAQHLEKHGLTARVEGPEDLSSSGSVLLETEGVRIVCLSYLDTGSTAHMRDAIRLRKRLQDVKVILGWWTASGDTATLKDLVKSDIVATSLRDTTRHGKALS